QFANLYYAIAHVPAVIIVLLWLFAFRRADYPPIRNVLALLTGACLVIQLVAVMPPRFLPELGFVDTAHLYGQSVYTQVGTGAANQ
ncbi:MAG: phosphatase PAP2 family protein, partial [Acidimicrobiales bacterium]|nr:phosphatase PAP2 family protein [Acidimicrobiales bacterium]